MFLGVVGVGEAAGRFDHDLHAYGIPRQRRRILFFENLDVLSIDLNAVGTRSDLVGQVAQYGVVLQKVSQSLRFRQIIDRYKLKIGIFERRPQNVAADSSKAINTYFDCHVSSLNL